MPDSLLTVWDRSSFTVPPGVLSVLPGYGATVGKELVSQPAVRKVDVTVSIKPPRGLRQCSQALSATQAGTSTGRALGSIVGGNLAAYTAELGGKVSVAAVYDHNDSTTPLYCRRRSLYSRMRI
jgi:acyl-CoA reductase-like NAD-dependent aldehyde dehydrogenase